MIDCHFYMTIKIKEVGNIPGEKELKKYLKQKTIPVKFCYLGKGADRWDQLRQHYTFNLGDRELIAFRNGLCKPESPRVVIVPQLAWH